MESQKSNIMFC